MILGNVTDAQSSENDDTASESSKHSQPDSPTLKVENKVVEKIPLTFIGPKSTTKTPSVPSIKEAPETSKSNAEKPSEESQGTNLS